MHLDYAVVTPARNEAENLPRLAASLASQTRPPRVWIVVDNGSTDDTLATLDQLSGAYPWLQTVSAAGEDGLVRGGPVTRAFHVGLDALGRVPEVVVKVDADVSFPPDYFEALLA